ncbi:MAG: hypothetical protein K8S98_03080 [Planctomycetes bacterium]|nr:hypothetical protein [Planctomycetota bacterium]
MRELTPSTIALRALVLALGLASCRSFHPPFPAVPDHAVPEAAPFFERRAEFYDAEATRKRREWHVWVYRDGRTLRDGEELEWWPDGRLRARRHFDHGEPSGEWATWFEDGTQSSESTLGGDELAPMRWWHPNGTLATEGVGRNGSREGRWRSWYANGVHESEGEYRDNHLEGEWIFWNDDGGECERVRYSRGLAVSE